MTTRTALTRRTVDRFLDRRGPVDHPVSAVLAAARPQDGAREVAGEQLAVARFLAGAHVSPEQRGVSLMNRVVRKALAAPFLALAVAGTAIAGGGVALAASQGALHVPFTGHDNRSENAPAAPASTNPGLDGTETPVAGSQTPEVEPTHAPEASPSPSLDGLCKAYQAGALKDGKKSPAFGALVTAAGGTENLAAYCVERVGAPKERPAKPAKPTKPAKPSQAADPTSPPRSGSADKPAPVRPTQAATPDKVSRTIAPR